MPPGAAGASKPVVPGLGPVPPAHVAAGGGIVHAVAHQALATPGAPELHQLAHNAVRDPVRWGGDLVLRAHAPDRYHELMRKGRLPSQVLAQHPGRLREQLIAAHAEHGRDLRFGHRPLGERGLLGVAAAARAHHDLARALDALRVHAAYTTRASFRRLMHGIAQHEVARLASAFLVPHERARVVGEYRLIRERMEREASARRLGQRRGCAT